MSMQGVPPGYEVPPTPPQQQQYDPNSHGYEVRHDNSGWQGGGGGAGTALSSLKKRGAKPFFATSEFATLLATVAAIVIAAAVDEGFDAGRAWTLVAAIAAAYIISRGLAKSGNSRDGSAFDEGR